MLSVCVCVCVRVHTYWQLGYFLKKYLFKFFVRFLSRLAGVLLWSSCIWTGGSKCFRRATREDSGGEEQRGECLHWEPWRAQARIQFSLCHLGAGYAYAAY